MMILFFTKLCILPFLLLYFKPIIIGKKNKKIKGKLIIISNHKSFWDALCIAYLFWKNVVHFLVTKAVYDRRNFAAWYIKQIGGIETPPISSGYSPISAAVEVLNKNKKVCIFPEGRINKTSELLPFKSGAIIAAIESGAPILPIYIGGKYGFFKRVRVVIGKPIYIYESKDKSDIVKATKMLEGVMNDLKKQCILLSK